MIKLIRKTMKRKQNASVLEEPLGKKLKYVKHDLKIILKDGELYTHKCILEHSNYFKTIFEDNECKEIDLTETEIERESFTYLLDYSMDCSNIDINLHKLTFPQSVKIYHVANYFNVPQLLKKIENHILNGYKYGIEMEELHKKILLSINIKSHNITKLYQMNRSHLIEYVINHCAIYINNVFIKRKLTDEHKELLEETYEKDMRNLIKVIRRLNKISRKYIDLYVYVMEFYIEKASLDLNVIVKKTNKVLLDHKELRKILFPLDKAKTQQ